MDSKPKDDYILQEIRDSCTHPHLFPVPRWQIREWIEQGYSPCMEERLLGYDPTFFTPTVWIKEGYKPIPYDYKLPAVPLAILPRRRPLSIWVHEGYKPTPYDWQHNVVDIECPRWEGRRRNRNTRLVQKWLPNCLKSASICTFHRYLPMGEKWESRLHAECWEELQQLAIERDAAGLQRIPPADGRGDGINDERLGR